MLNGDIWPLKSIAAPMMIGGFADRLAVVVPAKAASPTASAQNVPARAQ